MTDKTLRTDFEELRNGDQNLRRQYLEFRVRAVRRVPVSEVQK